MTVNPRFRDALKPFDFSFRRAYGRRAAKRGPEGGTGRRLAGMNTLLREPTQMQDFSFDCKLRRDACSPHHQRRCARFSCCERRPRHPSPDPGGGGLRKGGGNANLPNGNWIEKYGGETGIRTHTIFQLPENTTKSPLSVHIHSLTRSLYRLSILHSLART
jgi:hypothetical protein